MVHLSEFRAFSFPGGERHFNIDPTEAFLTRLRTEPLCARIRSANEIMDLALVVQFMRQNYIAPGTLILPYVPYARQDRATTEGSPFSLLAFTDILNSFRFTEVRVYEPHSAITLAAIHFCTVQHMYSEVASFLQKLQDEGRAMWKLVAPDVSAERKIHAAYPARSPIQAMKKRDPATGRLVLESVVGECANYDCVMVDDICDGGATFIPLAEELLRRGARSVSLFVAHGIFSKGFEPLKAAGISRIGTTNSFYTGESDDYVTVFPVF